MKEEYRTPTIDEFVQGFKFELRKDYSFNFLNFTESQKTVYEKVSDYSIWIPCEVWWKAKENEIITQTDKISGNTLTITGRANNFFKPFDEESFIKQGLIRVKI